MPTYEELLEIIAEQNKIIERLTAELASAKAEIAELKEKLNQNSRNSSKPPSTDGYEKPAPKSLRKKSGKRLVVKPDIKDIALYWINRIVLKESILSTVKTVQIGIAVPT